MIPFSRTPEPAHFDERVRQPGMAWLARAQAKDRPPAYWRRVAPDVREAFRSLCAYAAMYVPDGVVDHFRPLRHHPQLAYAWSNYRYASHLMNAIKGDAQGLLDPFDVRQGWFELLLPSLQLVVSDRVPPRWRALADHTLVRLRLRDDERILRWRQQWYALYREGRLSLEGLRAVAPLLAAAIERAEAADPRGGPPGDDVGA